MEARRVSGSDGEGEASGWMAESCAALRREEVGKSLSFAVVVAIVPGE